MNKKGFTLIEVMIVIGVFSIGVLAVLKLILYNMDVMDTLSTKSTATFLSKEGIELVYTIRDSNRLAGLPWDCVVNKSYNETINDEVCADYLLSGKQSAAWKIGFSSDSFYTIESYLLPKMFLDQFTLAALYFHSGAQNTPFFRYGYSDDGLATSFARYIVLTGVVENEHILPLDRIAKVESHVLFMKGGKTGEIVLESFIGNY